jgi:hypothetical protein
MVRWICLGFVAAVLLWWCFGDRWEDPHHIPAYAKRILEQANSFELFSLDPKDRKPKDGDLFCGWRVLGMTVVEKGDAIRLVEALEKGVAENNGEVADCFNPRHGIRAVHDGKSVDFVLCFECRQGFVSGKGKADTQFLVSGSPSTTFNAVLTKAGVPVAKPPCSN